MNGLDFSNYLPQRIFLLRGDESLFETIIAEMNDPLVQALSVPRFTIDHARSVAEFAAEGTGEERTFVIHFSVFSPEAAQVLLKSLEEPATKTTIIFITRYPYLVSQTVRSRLTLLSSAQQKEEKSTTKKKILEQIQKEAAEKDDDAALRRSRAVALLDELEASVKGDHMSADTIYQAKAMLFKANMPTKFVLDYIATVIR